LKNLLRSLRNQDGFTLVELMVVVAIIGLLSSVAIPNFKKYQAKAKVSEAKLQLSALYTAQAGFFSDYSMYGRCLPYMGFDPGPESDNRYYAIGFGQHPGIHTSSYSAAVNSGLNSVDCPRVITEVAGALRGVSVNNATWFPAGKGIGSAIANTLSYIDYGSDFGTQADDATMTYSVTAAGVISAGFTEASGSGAPGPRSVSILTINQDKVISTLANGF
jgi:prepilin-type N-terminal cleavage/methylation domain-containing protein